MPSATPLQLLCRSGGGSAHGGEDGVARLENRGVGVVGGAGRVRVHGLAHVGDEVGCLARAGARRRGQ